MFDRRMRYLDARFCQSDAHRDLLAHENVRVVRFGEAAFQFVELGRREARPVALLLNAAAAAAAGRLTAGAPDAVRVMVVAQALVALGAAVAAVRSRVRRRRRHGRRRCRRRRSLMKRHNRRVERRRRCRHRRRALLAGHDVRTCSFDQHIYWTCTQINKLIARADMQI